MVGMGQLRTHPALQLLALLGVLHLGAVGHTSELQLIHPLPVVFLFPKKKDPVALGFGCPHHHTCAYIHTHTLSDSPIFLGGVLQLGLSLIGTAQT